jgi:hypothetical protein
MNTSTEHYSYKYAKLISAHVLTFRFTPLCFMLFSINSLRIIIVSVLDREKECAGPYILSRVLVTHRRGFRAEKFASEEQS